MNSLANLKDEELIDHLRSGDQAAFKEIYLRYWALLYDHARKMLGDEAMAEDVVQDIFTHLLSSSDRLKIKTSLKSYLYQSVKNSVINHFHRDTNRQKYADSIKEFYEKGEYITDEKIMENELIQRIEQAVANFPAKMREVFELSRNHNLSRKEIAVATKTSENTVNAQLGRALKILKSKLTSLLF